MTKGTVGASIVSIITESLYDKPIVVFREYIQNAVDALDKTIADDHKDDCSAQIWMDGDDLCFLDNGTGIQPESFENIMISIAHSGKNKTDNLGYKGIGRLSGLPYCRELSFVNIADYANRRFQHYVIDGDKYDEVRKSEIYNELDFDELMGKIGSIVDAPDTDGILKLLGTRTKLFTNRNTGFLVILKDISGVLRSVIEDERFIDNLGWLLPVPFLPEMVIPSNENNASYELFSELYKTRPFGINSSIPAKSFNVFYNDEQIFRPLKKDMLRTYLCQSNLSEYAVCVHTFSNKKIELERKNQFSGIRVYIKNMLLCDENELIPALRQYGLIRQGSTYEVLQAVRGIGAMIYIVDDENISPNARRTFIDVTDEQSINFLALIGEFVDSVFSARYALSGYDSAKRKDDIGREKLASLRERAISALEELARTEITLEDDETCAPIDFHSLPKADQKKIVKNTITKELTARIKKYFSQTEEFNPDTCFNDFKTWLSAN